MRYNKIYYLEGKIHNLDTGRSQKRYCRLILAMPRQTVWFPTECRHLLINNIN
jgi:hypothetical protein